MFVDAIEQAARFTRPMHTISRNWESQTVVPGAATLFFVNADGWALTCAHVAKLLMAGDELPKKYAAFKSARAARASGYVPGAMCDIKNRFMACVEGSLNVEMRLHPSVDVALLKFTGYSRLLCDAFPVFARDDSGLKQGKFLCRLGFPFPEFTNFSFDSATDEIQWTTTGREHSPRFPIEGMVTRHLLGQDGKTIAGFEMSTPGLRGQSGGPAFDSGGRIWGMQSATKHLDLGFEGAKLHVGHCVHVSQLKEFMRSQGVAFSEG
jgi:hypothetical protein